MKIDPTRYTNFLGWFFLIFGHAIAAYFSYGYHHPDEHYQTFEFAHAFLGWSSPEHLAWEHRAQIRPWLQPFLHAGVMKLLALLGVDHPSWVATFIRSLYGTANVILAWQLWKHFRHRFSLPGVGWLVVSLLWFAPYLHVRTSSENLSALLLGWAFLQLWKVESELTAPGLRTLPVLRQIAVSGLLFGFAFVARPQVALGLVGLATALIWRSRGILATHFVLFFGFMAAVGLGAGIDRIGYGSWVLTPYRYFTVNLVEGVAATFNPYPWYQYFVWIAQLLPLISIPLFLGWIQFLRTRLTDPLSAFTLSFFVLHLFITNKEYRFLFPILSLVPWMAWVGLQKWQRFFTKPVFWVPYLMISIAAFAFSAARPASILTLWSQETYLRNREPNDLWISNHHFEISEHVAYYDLRRFVQPTVIAELHELKAAIEAAKSNPEQKKIRLLLDGSYDDVELNKMSEWAQASGCKIIERAIPLWLESARGRLPFLNKLGKKTVYDCT